MGPIGFYKWIKEQGYLPKQVYVSTKHKLLVDAKLAMYKCAYSIPIDSENYHQDIADALVARFGHFSNVTFVNDGKVDKQHPKHETDCKRSEKRLEQRTEVEHASKRLKVTDSEYYSLHPEIAEQLDEAILKVDRQARAARGVSYNDAIKVMQLLEAYPNFTCIQQEIGEADALIISMAHNYDFVVSEDGDLLCGGITNLLREFGSPKQCLYNAKDILYATKLSLSQLQQIACIAGNDYTKSKIAGMGLVRAYTLIRKYETCEHMIEKWTKKESKKFTLPKDLLLELEKGCALYNPVKAK